MASGDDGGNGRDKLLRAFLILAGASMVAFPISVLLHNLIYGLLIEWFGPQVWDRLGLGDEPVFFVIAVFVCPIGFLVGAVGSGVLLIRRWLSRRSRP